MLVAVAVAVAATVTRVAPTKFFMVDWYLSLLWGGSTDFSRWPMSALRCSRRMHDTQYTRWNECTEYLLINRYSGMRLQHLKTRKLIQIDFRGIVVPEVRPRSAFPLPATPSTTTYNNDIILTREAREKNSRQ